MWQECDSLFRVVNSLASIRPRKHDIKQGERRDRQTSLSLNAINKAMHITPLRPSLYFCKSDHKHSGSVELNLSAQKEEEKNQYGYICMV